MDQTFLAIISLVRGRLCFHHQTSPIGLGIFGLHGGVYFVNSGFILGGNERYFQGFRDGPLCRRQFFDYLESKKSGGGKRKRRNAK